MSSSSVHSGPAAPDFPPGAAGGTTGPSLWERMLLVCVVLLLASSYVSIAVNSLALGACALLWAAAMIRERRWGVSATPLDWCFAAYAGAEILSSIFSADPAQSFTLARRVLLVGIVYLLASTVGTRRRLQMLAVVLLASAAAVGTLGVGKLAFGNPVENTRLGIFQFYMTTSELMMIGVLLLAPFTVHPGTPWRIRAACVAGLVPVLVSLYATVTRGSYLAAAGGLVFIALARRPRVLLPLLVLFAAVLVFAPPYVRSRIESIVDFSHHENASRLMLWKTGLRMFADHPLVGIGDIDMHELYLRYAEEGDPAQHGHFHNVAVQFLVTLGIAGFAAVAALFVQIVRTEWRIYRRVRDDWFGGSLVLGSLAVFVGFHVSGLTEWTFGDQEIVTLFWITVGFALAAEKTALPLKEDHGHPHGGDARPE
ncbi:MAG: O-antigen ligase family protein [Bacteroidota bacterium]